MGHHLGIDIRITFVVLMGTIVSDGGRLGQGRRRGGVGDKGGERWWLCGGCAAGSSGGPWGGKGVHVSSVLWYEIGVKIIIIVFEPTVVNAVIGIIQTLSGVMGGGGIWGIPVLGIFGDAAAIWKKEAAENT